MPRTNYNLLSDSNLDDYLDNFWMGLGDVRKLKFDNKMIGPEWDDPLRVPELVIRTCCDPKYLHFFIKYILNINLLPFQGVILDTLWHKASPMVVCSRGASKSFMNAVYAVTRAVLDQGCKIVVVGASLRQSMVIHNYIQEIWDKSPILRDICTKSSGPKKDLHMAYCDFGDSRIICLPLGSGDKIRGQRASVILTEEFACLEPNTIVETDIGLMRIKDSFDVDNYKLYTGVGKELKDPQRYVKTPPISSYKITTGRGFSFRCSDIHQVRTKDGWKLAKDLTSDDWLVFENKYDFPTEYVGKNNFVVDEDIGWLMGVLLSEGCVSSPHSIYITNTDFNLIDRICVVLEKLGINYGIHDRPAYIDKRGWKCKASKQLYWCNIKFRQILADLGLDYCTALHKYIPWSILRSPRSVVLKFLSGLFEGDGSAFVNKSNELGISYYSGSEQLVNEVHILLWKLGILGNKGDRTNHISKNLQYFIRVNGEEAVNLGRILTIPKWKNVLEICNQNHKPSSNFSFDKNRNKWMATITWCGKCYNLGRFTTKEQAQNSIQHFKDHHPHCLKVNTVDFVEEKQELYDYYIPEYHSFIGNGFIQHNSMPVEIFETVVRGFAAVKSKGLFTNVQQKAKERAAREMGLVLHLEEMEQMYQSSVLKQNQIIISGTADYEFGHFFKYYNRYKTIIESGGDMDVIREKVPEIELTKSIDPSPYAILRIPYDVLPDDFMDQDIITAGKMTMDPQIFNMEYMAVFPSDSEGFYLASTIKAATCPVGNIVFLPLLYGDPQKVYIMGVDPASERDNFTINIMEMNDGYNGVVYQWSTTRKQFEKMKRDGIVGADIQDYNTYIVYHMRDLLRRFNIQIICMDIGGGGTSIRELLKDPHKMRPGDEPIYEFPEDDPNTANMKGRHILKMINFSSYEWRRDSHHLLRKNIGSRNTLFPLYDTAEIERINLQEDELQKDRPPDKRYYEFEICNTEILECKTETILIRQTKSPTGQERWDVPNIKGVDAENNKKQLKRDRFTSLLLANWGCHIYDGSRYVPPAYNYAVVHRNSPQKVGNKSSVGITKTSGGGRNVFF